MEKRFENELKRRRKEIIKFYYMEIGSLIRKKRLELRMTQEEVAKGIFSHTYLSKIEHNAISINKDALFLVMERINMSSEEYSLPEDMLELLENSLDCFFRGDREGYQRLFNDSLDFQYGILIDISRFGYYVMTGDTKNAKASNDELYRYLSVVEDFGFTIYALFASFYNIMIRDFITAKRMYESCKDYHSMSEEVFGLFEFAKFIIYGNLEQYNKSRDGYDNAKNIFISRGILPRIKEMSLYLNLFRMYEESENQFSIHNDIFQYAPISLIHNYIITKSVAEPIHLEELNMILPQTEYYPESLLIKAMHYIKLEDRAMYDSTVSLLKEHYLLNPGEEINYIELLDLKEKNDLLGYKEFLIQYILPYVSKQQNFFFQRIVNREIIEILAEHKRYKDGLMYKMKCEKAIRKAREIKR
ncbi:MAG: helix-turn-helix domain-containing protein [Firmicutes bacterium]|nr:helix-turn-helix domain-containing protein [Bacillota bacterium]